MIVVIGIVVSVTIFSRSLQADASTTSPHFVVVRTSSITEAQSTVYELHLSNDGNYLQVGPGLGYED